MRVFINHMVCDFRQDRRFNRMDTQKRVRMKKYYLSGDSSEVRAAHGIKNLYPSQYPRTVLFFILQF